MRLLKYLSSFKTGFFCLCNCCDSHRRLRIRTGDALKTCESPEFSRFIVSERAPVASSSSRIFLRHSEGRPSGAIVLMPAETRRNGDGDEWCNQWSATQRLGLLDIFLYCTQCTVHQLLWSPCVSRPCFKCAVSQVKQGYTWTLYLGCVHCWPSWSLK